MKKFICGLIIGCMLTGSMTFAASEILKATRASFKVMVDGKPFQSDKPIAVIDGSTYLPVKDTATAVKSTAIWDKETKTVWVGSRPIEYKSTNGLVITINNHGRYDKIEYEMCYVAVDMDFENKSSEPISIKASDIMFGDSQPDCAGVCFRSSVGGQDIENKTRTLQPGEKISETIMFSPKIVPEFIVKNQIPFVFYYKDPSSTIKMKYYY